jgi:hypothetical protein
LSDAPPAIAIAATAPTADTIRINRSFIDIDSELPALCNGLRIHAVPPSGLRAPLETRKPT